MYVCVCRWEKHFSFKQFNFLFSLCISISHLQYEASFYNELSITSVRTPSIRESNRANENLTTTTAIDTTTTTNNNNSPKRTKKNFSLLFLSFRKKRIKTNKLLLCANQNALHSDGQCNDDIVSSYIYICRRYQDSNGL